MLKKNPKIDVSLTEKVNGLPHYDPLLTMDNDLDLNTSDLSEWLDHHDPFQLEDEPSQGSLDIDCCMFDDDFSEGKKEGKNQSEDNCNNHLPSSKNNHSSSRQKARKVGNKKSIKKKKGGSRKNTQTLKSLSSTQIASDDDLYNATLDNLASSMKRSELSRAQILKHGASISIDYKELEPSIVGRFGDLLDGKRSALTANLEHSRKRLRLYFSFINRNQPF